MSYLCAPAKADDWPQFRGAERDGRSKETGLMDVWPENGPPLLWTADGVGNGYSSVSVVDDRLFTIGDAGENQFVFALDAADGSTIWKTSIGDSNETDVGGSRSTPTIHDGKVYAMSTDAKLFCLDAADGSQTWMRDLKQDFGASIMLGKGKYEWQFSESPLVDDGKVIVSPGADDAAIVALDQNSGEEVWRATIPRLGNNGVDGAAYSSVVVSHATGRKQYVQQVGRGVVGIDAQTGEFLWGYNRVANDVANIAAPIISGDYVFVSTGYHTGSALLKIIEKDGRLAAEEVFFLRGRELQNHHGGLILHEGHIYTGHGHNKGLPVCLNLETGDFAWNNIRNDGKSSAAIAFADGHLYFRYQNGLMVLIEATPDEYREKSSFMIPDVKRESWSHPVISGGRLYLKEQDRLHCYDITDKS